MKIRNETDFWSGVMFAAFGLFFALFAFKYDFGTAQRMGPAYFPTVLGALLALLGLYISLRAIALDRTDSSIGRFYLTEAGWVLGAVVVYGLLLRPAGALVSIAALVAISSMGSHEFRWKEVIALAIAMAAVTWVVFIWGLGVTIPVWPAFMER